ILSIVACGSDSASDPIINLSIVDQPLGGHLFGRITDSQTNAPITDAVIKLLDTQYRAITDADGYYLILNAPPDTFTVEISFDDYHTIKVVGIAISVNQTITFDYALTPSELPIETVTIQYGGTEDYNAEGVFHSKGRIIGGTGTTTSGMRIQRQTLGVSGSSAPGSINDMALRPPNLPPPEGGMPPFERLNTEDYNRIYENDFRRVVQYPLSTFSIDVDAASYSNCRRFIVGGSLPPPDAVRIEEFINYFNYDYPHPDNEHPFSITTEMSVCPWNEQNRLVHIGLQGRNVDAENIPPSNLVFLIDVSGSMQAENKLPLLKSAFRLLIEQLRPQDRVSLVVYASGTRVVLPPTSGDNAETILNAIDLLGARGSTAGSAGIQLAYKVAQQGFIEEGNNRVILATDGDFNVGPSSDAELTRLIESKRNNGIFLTVLGFGMGNYKDAKMEQLADKGNGNYAYIDNMMEAKKVLVTEMSGTLLTIAKDVKIQIEFNPAKVQAYRLVGYENRLLRDEEFNDDTRDAGEMGAGHTVTALYEIIPVGVEIDLPGVDSLRYQQTRISPDAVGSDDVMTVKLRYKRPDEDTSRLLTMPLADDDLALRRTSDNFRFSAAVAELGMLLRDSRFKGNASYEQLLVLARESKGEDDNGYRAEFIRLVEMAQLLHR
ncbi:MAG: von Willebrand factor type A domain-containing protein, partial [Candidatus Electryoneaceae bacterium]|nr:von Willebrand factor type A domain-containing protein [Candidatus Electryoneaceae bacterium]